jgi:hypothetical protein
VKTIATVLALLALTGCIDRMLTINSEPSGAAVFIDHKGLGTTPVSVKFTDYGGHDIQLMLKGYEPYHAKLTLEQPGWAVFPIDVVTEAVLPVKFDDTREVTVTLTKPRVDIK